MIHYYQQHKVLIGIIFLGIALRVFFAFSFNHVFDFFNILAIVKAEAVTHSALDGLLAVQQASRHEIQLYGKIFYQIIGAWVRILEVLNLVNFKEIFTIPHSINLGYLAGFGEFGPKHYELVLIKFIQFFFEGAFLGFFLLIIRTIKPHSQSAILSGALFWAINPFLIYPSFVPFQSDLAMMSCLLGGVYFSLLAHKQKQGLLPSIFIILMTGMLALGSVIKQVPLLFLIPLIFLAAPRMKSLALGMISFAIFYLLASQPWSVDTSLYKSQFLLSTESIAILKFNLNSASIFLILYAFFVFGVIKHKAEIRSNPWNFIYVVVMLFAIIFITEDVNYVFAQFAMWIMPFLFILLLKDRVIGIFFLAPVVGFYRWIVVDNGATTGSLWVTFGKPLSDIPSSDFIIKQILSPYIVHTGFNSLFLMLYILLAIYIVRKDMRFNLPKIFSPNILTLGLFVIYFIYFSIDFTYRASHVKLTNNSYTNTFDQKLQTNPIIVHVSNPQKKEITALDISLRKDSIERIDNVIIEIWGSDGELVVKKRVSDFVIPKNYEDYYIHLGESINERKFVVKIFKEFGFNEVLVKIAQQKGHPPDKTQGYMHYDSYYQSNSLDFDFEGPVVAMNLRGKYSFIEMSANLHYHFLQNPTFYVIFSVFLMGCIVISVPVWVSLISKKKRSIWNM